MIKTFFQYSYGGYKTLAVSCVENELLDNEVTNDNLCDFPDDAHCYFQYGGSKIVYRYLNDGRLCLVVREMPSIHKDGSGRSIPFAVQFIGDDQDRQTMDFMTIDIANDVNKFHEFLSNLFYVRQGLRIQGEKLSEWIENHKVPFSCNTDVRQIKQISKIKSGVLFFVSLSSKFGVDEYVTNNVSQELNLPYKQMKKDSCIMNTEKLFEIQQKSVISAGIIEVPPSKKPEPDGVGTNKDEVDRLKKIIEDKDKEIADLINKANTHFDTITKLNSKIEEKEEENAELNNKLKLNKKCFYVAVGAAGVLAIVSLISMFSK